MSLSRLAAHSIRSARSRTILGHGNQRLFSDNTYYDSQSGLHLPVHNEKEIRIFLNVSSQSDKEEEPFVPHQLYKRSDEAYEMEDIFKDLTKKGIHGVILPKFQFPRDARNLEALSAIAPPNFFVLYSQETPQPPKSKEMKENTSAILSLGESSSDDDELRSSLDSLVKNELHTTLSVTEQDYMNDIEAITLANKIASMIDAVGGCDFLCLSAKNDSAGDKAFDVCEELIYLDVAGPTIKSRLLIESLNDEVLEDSMFAGVNKFVVEDESHVETIESVASSQRKSIVKG